MLYANEIEEDKIKQQAGIWFGPVTPFPGSEISDYLNTYLGGGLFYRIALPSNTWMTEVGISYSYYQSDTTAALDSVPFYTAIVYKLPFELPVDINAKAGLGGNFLMVYPEEKYNTFPLFFSGFEMSFPAGKWVNIGLRADYYFVYEKYLDPPEDAVNYKKINGHFFNLGLMVNVNINR